MIVITGPGRSGTSVLAALYRELGFDPGGEWDSRINAGLEDLEVHELNCQIVAALGAKIVGHRGDVPAGIRQCLKPLLPSGLRRWLRVAVQRRRPQSALDHVRWSQFSTIEERIGDRLVAVAAKHEVVKDPQFCFTLPVWLAAGADISHVVVTVRPSAASAASRATANHSNYACDDLLRSSIALALGCLVDALISHSVPYTMLRFPDWTEQAGRLAVDLPFPYPVEAHAVEAALAGIIRRDLIHHDAVAAHRAVISGKLLKDLSR